MTKTDTERAHAFVASVRLCEAAPDLLNACKAALNDRMFTEWPGIATLLINAIAKAEGEVTEQTNALLSAAAPDLLKALRVARHELACNGFELANGLRHPVLIDVDMAIAKAEGR